ncbi:MAG TPA: hypothetical protein VFZ44_02175, partial [Pyrinomonadaceae bacterium]
LRLKGEGQETAVSIPLGDFEGVEWVALFRDVLNCPVGVEGPYTRDSDLGERIEKFRLKFQQMTKEYPMLGRILNPYVDVTYESEEVVKLRDECLRVRLAAKSNQIALEGLSKLADACDEALSHGASLELTCD